jgi:hypothetical protein
MQTIFVVHPEDRWSHQEACPSLRIRLWKKVVDVRLTFDQIIFQIGRIQGTGQSPQQVFKRKKAFANGAAGAIMTHSQKPVPRVWERRFGDFQGSLYVRVAGESSVL